MNNRQIETSREIRLWVTGIIGPVIIGAATIIANNPEARDLAWLKAKETFAKVKAKITK